MEPLHPFTLHSTWCVCIPCWHDNTDSISGMDHCWWRGDWLVFVELIVTSILYCCNCLLSAYYYTPIYTPSFQISNHVGVVVVGNNSMVVGMADPTHEGGCSRTTSRGQRSWCRDCSSCYCSSNGDMCLHRWREWWMSIGMYGFCGWYRTLFTTGLVGQMFCRWWGIQGTQTTLSEGMSDMLVLW